MKHYQNSLSVTMFLTACRYRYGANAQEWRLIIDIKTVGTEARGGPWITDSGRNDKLKLVEADTVASRRRSGVHGVVLPMSAVNVRRTSSSPTRFRTQLTYVEGSAFGPGAPKCNSRLMAGRQFRYRRRTSRCLRTALDRPARNEDFTHIRWVMSERHRTGRAGHGAVPGAAQLVRFLQEPALGN